MIEPVNLPHIKNITISGRIASGQTTLAKSLSERLDWEMWEGGALTEEYFRNELENKDEVDVYARPESHELWMDDLIKKMLKEKTNQIIQSNLAGYNAQGIEGVLKILTVCENEAGIDQTNVRIDRLVNRKGISVSDAKINILERERKNRDRWSKLYADNDPDWYYWDKKYYDLVVNTYFLNREESVNTVMQVLKSV